MESLEELVTLVTNNLEGRVVPAWTAGRLIQAIKDRDEEIKKLRDRQVLDKFSNDFD